MNTAADTFMAADVLSWYTEGLTRDNWIDLLDDLDDNTRDNIIEHAKGMGDFVR